MLDGFRPQNVDCGTGGAYTAGLLAAAAIDSSELGMEDGAVVALLNLVFSMEADASGTDPLGDALALPLSFSDVVLASGRPIPRFCLPPNCPAAATICGPVD